MLDVKMVESQAITMASTINSDSNAITNLSNFGASKCTRLILT
jgi:hypothetical protein